LATLFLFLVPASASLGVRITMAALGYLLWDMVYTVSDVPVYAMSTAMTEDVKERGRLISYARLAASFGGMLISLFIPPLIERMGYLTPALIICAGCYLTMLPICAVAKERCATHPQGRGDGGIREMLTYLKGNKYLLLIFGAICVKDMFTVALNNYVAKYCLGSLDYLSIITVASIVPALLTYLIVPKLLQYMDKILLYKVSLLVNVLLGILLYFVGYHNITVYIVFMALRAFAGGIPSLLMFTFAADCVEYGQFKTGIRKEGITFSIQTFTAKFTAAISGAISGLVLLMMNYDATLAVQSAETAAQFWFYSSWVPVVGAVLCMPLLMMYTLCDRDVQIMADVNAGRMTRQEAEGSLSKQY
ncbi:MAG: MFS transporter, partial [Angelakisella sp.]